MPETPEQLYARVAASLRMPPVAPQLIGSFAVIWDDILPPVPEDLWTADLVAIAGALATAV